jgi:hypothetical protein
LYFTPFFILNHGSYWNIFQTDLQVIAPREIIVLPLPGFMVYLKATSGRYWRDYAQRNTPDRGIPA